MPGNNITARGRAKATTIEATASLENTIATIEATASTTPTVAPPIEPPKTRPTPTAPKPMHTSIDGRGAWVWRKTGDHQTETVWDPSAPAVVPTPLPLGQDLQGTCIMLAKKHGLDKAAFLTFCHSHTTLVRACARRYMIGQQWVEFDPLVQAFREQPKP